MADGSAPQGQATDDRVDDAVLREFVGYNLRRAYLTIQEDFLAQLAKLELRAVSFSALSLIVDNPDIIQSRLAEALSMERSNLVVIVDQLEQRDLITRSKLKSDRRVHALRATLKGRRLRDRAAALVKAHEDRLLADFTPAERKNLIAMLNRIEG
jgi:DNA-binding MarR family transcriptional regulator